MKKGILFALAALCVSAVQAVTINWTVENPTYYGDSGDQWVGAVLISGAVTDFSPTALGITYNTGNKTITSTHTDFLGGSLQEVKANVASAKTPINNSITVDSLAGITDLTIIFVAPYQFADQKQSNAYSYYTFTEGQLAQLDLTADTINIGLDSINLKNTQPTQAVVPEPTALALLALGVAGLALRRKA